MSSQILFSFLGAFLFWFTSLVMNLVLLIKPKFIFRKGPPTPQQNMIVIVACLIALFMSSFILGVMTFLMRVLNGIIIF